MPPTLVLIPVQRWGDSRRMHRYSLTVSNARWCATGDQDDWGRGKGAGGGEEESLILHFVTTCGSREDPGFLFDHRGDKSAYGLEPEQIFSMNTTGKRKEEENNHTGFTEGETILQVKCLHLLIITEIHGIERMLSPALLVA